MREVKFRAWEKNMKIMMPVENIDFLTKQINTNSLWRMFHEIELMQYTGLKDKNGKDIYEGDVLRDSESIVIVKFQMVSLVLITGLWAVNGEITTVCLVTLKTMKGKSSAISTRIQNY